MKAVAVFLSLAVAVALQTTLAGFTIGSQTPANLVLVAVVFLALSFGAVTGMLAGTVGGLVQDALAGGIVGLGGLSKTVVGFVVGVMGAQFIIAQALPRSVMFVAATVLHELCFQALHALTGPRGFSFNTTAVLTQGAVNAAIGLLAFYIVENGPAFLKHREARRNTLGRGRY